MKTVSKISITTTILGILLLLPAYVSAVVIPQREPEPYKLQLFVEDIPEAIDLYEKRSQLIVEGRRLIIERLQTLSHLKTSTLLFPRGVIPTPHGTAYGLSDVQRNSLLAMINPKIKALRILLLRKLRTAADADEARAMVKSIYTDYRIFSVFVPHYGLTEGLYKMQNRILQIDAFLKEQRVYVNRLKGQGVDVSVQEAALNDAESELPNFDQEITDALQKLAALTPADYRMKSEEILTEAFSSFEAVRTGLDGLLAEVEAALSQ